MFGKTSYYFKNQKNGGLLWQNQWVNENLENLQTI